MMSDNKTFLAQNTQYLREQRGWTSTKLAEMLETIVPYINAIEWNKTTPNLAFIERMADIFDVSTQMLLFVDLEAKTKILTMLFSNPNVVRLPKYHRDVGYDIIAPVDFTVRRWGCTEVVIPTTITPPEGHFADITTRGSIDRLGLTINGTIDPTFNGYVLIAVKNNSWRRHKIRAGTAIAQVRFLAYSNPHSEHNKLPIRGDKKRGSTDN